MAIYKNILKPIMLISVISLTIFIICSCQQRQHMTNNDYNFPKDESGYPKHDVIIINDTTYSLKDLSNQKVNIKIKNDNENIEVLLPQYLPTYTWSIEESENINLISYNKITYNIEDIKEGVSPDIQRFEFNIEPNQSVLFKWSNINELGKSFKEKNEEILLELNILK